MEYHSTLPWAVTSAMACFLFLLVSASQSQVLVQPVDCSLQSFSSCINLTTALANLTEPNTELSLLPNGDHVLQKSHIVQGLSGIKIHSSSPWPAVITCASRGVGLAFVGMQNLSITNIQIVGCGMSGQALRLATQMVRESVEMFFDVAYEYLHIALFLGNIVDASLHQVNISNTTGLGMVAVSVVGNFSLRNFSAIGNKERECQFDSLHSIPHSEYNAGVYIGGGAFILYHDYNTSMDSGSEVQLTASGSVVAAQLTISAGSFVNNSDCSATGFISQRLRYRRFLRGQHGFIVGAGGGLSLVLAQRQYKVSIVISHSHFHSNKGLFGAGLFIGTFHGINSCSVTVSDCSFTNGEQPSGAAISSGGGVAILGSILSPHSSSSISSSVPEGEVAISIERSRFEHNRAYIGGGLYAFLLRYASNSLGVERISLLLSHCEFLSNTADYGAAAYLYEENIVTASMQAVFRFPRQFIMSDVRVKSNQINNYIRSSRNATGVIDVRYINFTLQGTSELNHNWATVIRAKRSLVLLQGNVKFVHNIGVSGGVFSLLAHSYLIVKPNTSILFSHNQATLRGGVLYVLMQDDPTFTLDGCFLILNSTDHFLCEIEDKCSGIARLGINITFVGNTAPQGNLVYGCSLVPCLLGNTSESFRRFWAFLEDRNLVFNFDKSPVDDNQVITHTSYMTANNTAGVLAMPGQEFRVVLKAFDERETETATAVSSTILPYSIKRRRSTGHNALITNSVIGHSNYWSVGNNSNPVPVRAYGEEGTETNVTIFTVDSGVKVTLLVLLTECSAGFHYHRDQGQCRCKREELERQQIECSEVHHRLEIPSRKWMGVVGNGSENVVVGNCPYDYCPRGTKLIQPNDFDAQCSSGHHRTGLLCGSCVEGYSRALGTNRCKKCTNNAFLALILFFAAAGFLVVGLVALLKVTISEGFLNGMLLYSHILTDLIFDLAPNNLYLFLPLTFLNLELGIETCLYNGMTALVYTALQLAFPFYIVCLMGLIIILARKIRCPHKLNFSAGKTFATLLLLSHAHILHNCMRILHSVRLHSISGAQSHALRWAVDPEVRYFHGWHAVLGVLAIVLLLGYLIPLPLFLLFPARAYNCKYSNRLKPLLDAYYAPYKPQFRCWVAVRMLVVTAVNAVILNVAYPMYIMVATLLITLLLYVQVQIRPFSGRGRNATDSFLIFNMLLLIFCIILFRDSHEEHLIHTTLLLMSAYTVFLGVLVYHVILLLPARWKDRVQAKLARTRLFQLLRELSHNQKPSHPRGRFATDIDLSSYHRYRAESMSAVEEEESGHYSCFIDAPQDMEGLAEIGSFHST